MWFDVSSWLTQCKDLSPSATQNFPSHCLILVSLKFWRNCSVSTISRIQNSGNRGGVLYFPVSNCEFEMWKVCYCFVLIRSAFMPSEFLRSRNYFFSSWQFRNEMSLKQFSCGSYLSISNVNECWTDNGGFSNVVYTNTPEFYSIQIFLCNFCSSHAQFTLTFSIKQICRSSNLCFVCFRCRWMLEQQWCLPLWWNLY